MTRAHSLRVLAPILIALAAVAGCTTVNTAPAESEPRTGGEETSPVFIAEFTRVIEFGGIERWSDRSPREPFVEVAAPRGWKELPPVVLSEIEAKSVLLEGIVEVAERPYYLRVMSRSEGKHLFIWHEYLAARYLGITPAKSPLKVLRTAPSQATGTRMQSHEALPDGEERCRTLEKFVCTVDSGERYEYWLDVTSWGDCAEVYGTVQGTQSPPKDPPKSPPKDSPAVVKTR